MVKDELKYQYKRWYGTFLGYKQAHAYWMYKVIEDVIKNNKQIKGIIEIGTGHGSLTIFLGLQCYERGLKPLLTYDNVLPPREPKLFKLLGIRFIQRDIFNKESIREMTEYMDSPILFFSDNGMKIRDFKFFLPLLPKESVFASHDWMNTASGGRLTEENTKDNVEKYGLIPLYKEEWDAPPDYIKTCFWRKTK